ncbi:hypothetical protein VTI74DRAFT_6496 [Chaetomium olivicolor]
MTERGENVGSGCRFISIEGCSWEMGLPQSVGRGEIWEKDGRPVQPAMVWRRELASRTPSLPLPLATTRRASSCVVGACAGTGLYGPIAIAMYAGMGPSIACSTKAEIGCARRCPATCEGGVRSAQCRVGGGAGWASSYEGLRRDRGQGCWLRYRLGCIANQAWSSRRDLDSHINSRLNKGHNRPAIPKGSLTWRRAARLEQKQAPQCGEHEPWIAVRFWAVAFQRQDRGA